MLNICERDDSYSGTKFAITAKFYRACAIFAFVWHKQAQAGSGLRFILAFIGLNCQITCRRGAFPGAVAAAARGAPCA
jgi:hypothetical protein